MNTQEATHTEKTPSPIEETPPEAEHPEPEVPKVETVIEVSPKSEPEKHEEAPVKKRMMIRLHVLFVIKPCQ